jgi:hypothetical protein
MIQKLRELEGQLTPAEREERETAFQEMEQFLQTAAAAGGVDARISKSFPRKVRGGIRIDLEVIKGRACTPD